METTNTRSGQIRQANTSSQGDKADVYHGVSELFRQAETLREQQQLQLAIPASDSIAREEKTP